MPQLFAAADIDSLPLHLIEEAELHEALARLPAAARKWAETQGFRATLGQCCVLPNAEGGLAGALFGLGSAAARARGRFHIAKAAETLPEAIWHLEGKLSSDEAEEAALGWLLANYRFERYKATPAPKARLKCPANVNAARIEAIASGEALTRDLINTPASDMGPDELEAAFFALASRHGASASAICAEDLLQHGLPMIHAVGRASPRAPRLLDLRWGATGPKLTLVGKGVCFDTGGLDLKPATGMGLMKKDMGGAATVMGLAEMIMALGLPLQLRVLVPAVENAVSGNAFRPQDILTSRKGLTVEVNNTDAEGRLVLADALTLADEEHPDLMICMATLTGAARVALGPDLPPFYTDDDELAAALAQAAHRVADPVWRMPLWEPYEAHIEPAIADLDNAPSGGMAGSITAALFLRRFVTQTRHFAHFDIYGWQPTPAPGRAKGGVGQAARAVLEALPTVLRLPPRAEG
jgi:leucyl aminopeptidase